MKPICKITVHHPTLFDVAVYRESKPFFTVFTMFVVLEAYTRSLFICFIEASMNIGYCQYIWQKCNCMYWDSSLLFQNRFDEDNIS